MAEMNDAYAPKNGGLPSYPGGKFAFDPICSPKETESSDGVLKSTGDTLPGGAARPKK